MIAYDYDKGVFQPPAVAQCRKQLRHARLGYAGCAPDPIAGLTGHRQFAFGLEGPVQRLRIERHEEFAVRLFDPLGSSCVGYGVIDSHIVDIGPIEIVSGNGLIVSRRLEEFAKSAPIERR